jgi:hypothetical protein
VAPLVPVTVAFVSRNPRASKMVLWSMAALLGLGLSFGLVTPSLGATAGFVAAGALTLNPPKVEAVNKWRLAAVVFTIVYTLVLLVVVNPAGTFGGGLLPLLMVGFADEYAMWSGRRAVDR